MAEKFRLMEGCPGAANLRTPPLAIRRCPQVGEEIEIFSHEVSATCGRCGFVVYNDRASCIRWCRYAARCVGEDTVMRFREALEGQAGRGVRSRGRGASGCRCFRNPLSQIGF